MSKETNDKEVLQWHPAFYASLQIEFAEEVGKLIFENEHQLGTKPKEIDVLIIKKNSSDRIQKNLGRIFRKHNIVEYKSPKDYLSVDDFYKVYGYACFYKADTPKENQIPIEDITITFVCHAYPRKMMQHLREVRKRDIVKRESGIYYIHNDIFPIQLIVTSKLTDEDNLWLKNLTDDLRERQIAERLVDEYEQHNRDTNYESAMDAIIRANRGMFMEVSGMCNALREILEEIAEERAVKMAEERAEKMAEKIAENKICSLVGKGLLKLEDAAAELGITPEEMEEKMKNVENLTC